MTLPCHPSSSCALLACDVFSQEITTLLPEMASPPSPVIYLEMGLHDHPDTLRARLQEKIRELEARPEIATILLAYGQCGQGLAGIHAGRCTLVLPRAHDCISILLGGIAAHAAVLRENPGVYFYSPGWIKGRRVPGPDREAYLRACYQRRYPDDAETVEELLAVEAEVFAHHNGAAYVEVTPSPEAEAYCRRCAAHQGWTFRRLDGQREFLQMLLSGPHPAERFLVVRPGQSIDVGADGLLEVAPA